MSVIENFQSNLSLEELQALTEEYEPMVGPIDGLAVAELNGQKVTAITFDTGIIVDVSISNLIIAGTSELPTSIPFFRGHCFISDVDQEIFVYIKDDQDLLIQRCLSFLLGSGWNRAQSIGIIANIRYESQFNPAAIGDGGTAYGLCQWRGSRQDDFRQYWGWPIDGSGFREQLEFIVWELNNTELKAGELLRAADTAAEAARVVCEEYERPADPTKDSALRAAYAQELDTQIP